MFIDKLPGTVPHLSKISYSPVVTAPRNMKSLKQTQVFKTVCILEKVSVFLIFVPESVVLRIDTRALRCTTESQPRLIACNF